MSSSLIPILGGGSRGQSGALAEHVDADVAGLAEADEDLDVAVLPALLGPRNAKVAPRRISRATARSASRLP
jgi:hypothetical protein